MTEDNEPASHITLGITVTLEARPTADGKNALYATVNEDPPERAIFLGKTDRAITQGELRQLADALETGLDEMAHTELEGVLPAVLAPPETAVHALKAATFASSSAVHG